MVERVDDLVGFDGRLGYGWLDLAERSLAPTTRDYWTSERNVVSVTRYLPFPDGGSSRLLNIAAMLVNITFSARSSMVVQRAIARRGSLKRAIAEQRAADLDPPIEKYHDEESDKP